VFRIQSKSVSPNEETFVINWAQSNEIRIAHIYSKTGALEAYGKQTQTGFMMGLDYATGGTMMVNGKKIVVIEKDDQGKPDLGKSLLAAAYSDDKADAGRRPDRPRAWRWPCCRSPRNTRRSCWSSPPWPTRSPATSGTSTSSAPAATEPGRDLQRRGHRQGRRHRRHAGAGLRLRPRRREGLQGAALKKAKIVHEEYLPPATTDFTAGAQRLIDKLKDQPGRKIIWIVWAGAGNPFKIADLDLKRYGIEIATGGNILPAMAAYKSLPGMEGAPTTTSASRRTR
jgi:branched-chain amino acid transport system substrate-binding protein